MSRCHPVDLRNAFTLPSAYDSGTGAGDAGGNDPDEPRDPDSSPPAATPGAPADTAGGGGKGNANPPDGSEAPAHPELKKLHDEAARYRVRAKTAEDYVASLTAENRTLRLRMAFNTRAGEANISDTDAAWKLAADDLDKIGINDDGEVDADRLGQVTNHLVTRYPYLVAEAPPTPQDQALRDQFPALAPSGRSTERRRPYGRPGLDDARLVGKYPALRRRP